MLNNNICQQARLSKDVRFDGKFFTAVLTTGIFCRPICPARAPKEENVRYYKNALQAQAAGFRPCKRCLPELAPQTHIPRSIKQLTQALESGSSLTTICENFQLSERQLRRIFIKHYGLPPSKYLHNQKLLLASKLLKTTRLSITEIAFAAGFNSIRRFNEAIKLAYKCTPSAIKKTPREKLITTTSVNIELAYRPPFDWPLMLSFFRLRQLDSVEQVSETHYRRTIEINSTKGWFEVSAITNKLALRLTVQLEDYRYLNQVIIRVRRMFDLDADMLVIHQYLSHHLQLKMVIKQYPGLRLPGCWDKFEFSIRAILGQQISVKAATTLANRISVKYGDKALANPFGLTHIFPNQKELINVDYQNIGLTKSRISTLHNWLDFYLEHSDILSCYSSIEALEKQLITIKGIGPWTVNYLAMRGLSDPDAFPSADLGIIKALTMNDKKLSNKDILALSEQWRPWRAYAAIYLWYSLGH
ncbi:MAG: DNA-3-methyladenine glycosylase 2 family protein [Alteromonadaceae bacterium]|nr:DNA-3-methyladenine glycosylase 2 family protein [Alteromonadaceae bacterium]